MLLNQAHKRFVVLLFLTAGVIIAAQSVDPDLADLMRQTENRLNNAFAADIEGAQFKKIEIKLTNDGFFRYRRTYLNGKQEYFSFNFSQFEDLEYLGTTHLGFLVMKTKPESIIVQTFRDAKGDIDSMATELRVPLKDLEVADLQTFQVCFSKIHEKLKQP